MTDKDLALRMAALERDVDHLRQEISQIHSDITIQNAAMNIQRKHGRFFRVIALLFFIVGIGAFSYVHLDNRRMHEETVASLQGKNTACQKADGFSNLGK